MKKIGLILSLVAMSSCAATFPAKEAYVADLTNLVCARYQIYDLEEIKFRLLEELPLVKKGPCDRMMGFKRGDVNPVLNYIRKVSKGSK